jgi:hypothetical protein
MLEQLKICQIQAFGYPKSSGTKKGGMTKDDQ